MEQKQTAAQLLVNNLTDAQQEKEALMQQAQQQAEGLKDAAFDTMRKMVDLRNKIRTLEQEQDVYKRQYESAG